MHFFKNIIYKILELQERFLRLKLSKTIGAKNHSKKKRHYSQGCTLDLNTMAEVERQELEEKLSNILKSYDFNPARILEYVQSQGTEIKYFKDAKKILNPICENEGFIYPATGIKALYISLAVNKKLSFRTKEMFLISKGEINKYYFIYHLYNWFAFKNNIQGMEPESQELLKKYLFSDKDTKKLQLAEIFKLKEAIIQDKAAIEFVINLCRNYDGAKQALEKMKSEGSAQL